jgi:hypothetical protein
MTPTRFTRDCQHFNLRTMSAATSPTRHHSPLVGPEIADVLESGEIPTGRIACGPFVQSTAPEQSTEVPYDTLKGRDRLPNCEKPIYHIFGTIPSVPNTQPSRCFDRESGGVCFQPRIRC